MSNYIQRAWLRLLSPVAYVINERIAKRPGFFGKIGKWFQVGPREYGMHPTNRAFVFLNRRYNFASAVLLHRYSVIKTLTHNGYHMIRPFKHLNFLGPLAVFFGLLRFVYHGSFTRGYEPDRLTYVSRRIGGRMGLPLSTLNHRTSAHFIEINYIYGAEMMKRYHRTHSKIIEERNRLSEDERKTRYAAPGYKYEAPKPVYLPPVTWD